MENLGAQLRKLREDKGLSYAKVQEDLLLRELQIRLMEDNRFSELGPSGLARAMVHKYAAYLEADLNEVMAELKVMLPERINKEFKPKKVVKEKKILLSPNFLWLIGIILFVVVLGTILWHAYTRGWLETPDIFKSSAADTTVVVSKEHQEPKPDPMRDRQKQISEALGRQSSAPVSNAIRETIAVQDSTDHLGQILGPSQVNVPLN
ncbi:MAG: helix-turn-helix domain-containing protein [Candidatus Syntrophosphaera sp.]|nr:helix-turn-helix domain-containing protein [Candidatus Syntrophosphaera sp.]